MLWCGRRREPEPNTHSNLLSSTNITVKRQPSLLRRRNTSPQPPTAWALFHKIPRYPRKKKN
jgi:hypothetical protein